MLAAGVSTQNHFNELNQFLIFEALSVFGTISFISFQFCFIPNTFQFQVFQISHWKSSKNQILKVRKNEVQKVHILYFDWILTIWITQLWVLFSEIKQSNRNQMLKRTTNKDFQILFFNSMIFFSERKKYFLSPVPIQFGFN